MRNIAIRPVHPDMRVHADEQHEIVVRGRVGGTVLVFSDAELADLRDKLSAYIPAAPAPSAHNGHYGVSTERVGPCKNCGNQLRRWPDGNLTADPGLTRWCGETHDGHEVSAGGCGRSVNECRVCEGQDCPPLSAGGRPHKPHGQCATVEGVR